MAQEYRSEQEQKIENQIADLMSTAPQYVKDFAEQMSNGKRESSTQLSYLRNVMSFIEYYKSTTEDFKDCSVSNIPLAVFDQLHLKELNQYRQYLKNTRGLENVTIRKHVASLSAFYHYLNMVNLTKNNPMQFVETPVVNKKKIVRLDSELSNKLLNGILRNDMYLIESNDPDTPDRIVDILPDVQIKRERLVLRNYAICCLFLGTGMRVSELVGMDLDDIDFRQNSINVVVKGGDTATVFFGNEVAKALKDYIHGPSIDQELLNYKYEHPEVDEWCKAHKSDPKFEAHLNEQFPELEESIKRNIIKLRYSLLRQGRQALIPKKGCNAVFITTRGTRMSVRSVELMVKEMVKTYLPEYDDKDKFSPHKFRSTCATRILAQTGDIKLASTQLNHKGIEVTAAFYSEMLKDKQKQVVMELDINEW